MTHRRIQDRSTALAKARAHLRQLRMEHAEALRQVYYDHVRSALESGSCHLHTWTAAFCTMTNRHRGRSYAIARLVHEPVERRLP